jgi:hypothetical protein
MKLSLLSLLLAASASANQFARRSRLTPPLLEADADDFPIATGSGATNGTGFFTQLINHDDPSAGTFQQRYYYNSEFWAGPGSPVRFNSAVICRGEC